MKQQDPDYDDRSVSKSYRSDGTEIKENDEDYDDPQCRGVRAKLQGRRDRIATGRSGLGRPLPRIFCAVIGDELDRHELSVQPIKPSPRTARRSRLPSPAKSDALIKDFLSSPSKSDVTYRSGGSPHKYQEAASPVQSDLSSPAKDDVSYRSDGSVIKPTDPDFATDGLRYREDGTEKLPGDDDYNIPPSYRSDRTLIQKGDPDYVAGTFDRRTTPRGAGCRGIEGAGGRGFGTKGAARGRSRRS